MSDTPRIVCQHGVTLGWHCGDCSAERLERELTAALARAEKAERERDLRLREFRGITTDHCNEIAALRAERDGLRRQVDRLCDVIDETIGATTEYAEWKDITEMLQKALAEARKETP